MKKKFAMILSFITLSSSLSGCALSESSNLSTENSSNTYSQVFSDEISETGSPEQSLTQSNSNSENDVDEEYLRQLAELEISLYTDIEPPQSLLDYLGQTKEEYLIEYYKSKGSVLLETTSNGGLYSLVVDEGEKRVFVCHRLPVCEDKLLETAYAVAGVATITNDDIISLLKNYDSAFFKIKNNSFDDICAIGFHKVSDKWFSINDITWFDSECEEIYKQGITSNSSSSSETDSANDGIVLYNQNDILIKYKSWEVSKTGSIEVNLYIENNSAKDFYVRTENFSADNYQMIINGTWKVNAGKKLNDSITIYKTEMEKNGLSEIRNAEFNFEISDVDYSIKYVTDTITLKLK